MKTNQVETKKNEIKIRTTDPELMYDKYLTEDVLKTWKEDFIDPDSGEVIALDRSQVLFKKGSLVTTDMIPEIRFFQSAGDIYDIEVSNQQRLAKMVYLKGMTPWLVTVQFSKSKHRILLYANSVQMAIDVTNDYVELNFEEPFYILSIRNFADCIIMPEEEKEQTEEGEQDQEEAGPEKKFYKIDVKVKMESGDYNSIFVINTINVDSAMFRIYAWIHEQTKKRAEKRDKNLSTEFETAIESAVVIPCSRTIEREFSYAYLNTLQ